MGITVVSTGFDPPTKHVCIASVKSQTVAANHVVIDAAEQDPPRAASQNFYEAVAKLPPDEIVVWLDLDDWLARRDALEIVSRYYTRNPWLLVTYGSFVTTDGKEGISAAYDPSENVRTAPWRASHLKTFRAKVIQAIDPEDL